MRLHPLSIVLSIPAIFLACSSGGPGSAPAPGSGGAFGQPGATTPALAPGGGGGGTTQTPDPPADTGTATQDTGTATQDTGTAPMDTSGGDVCSTPSRCSDPLIDSATCSSATSDPTCGTLAKAYFACLYANQVCQGSGGPTDQGATAAACPSQQSAYSSCVGG